MQGTYASNFSSNYLYISCLFYLEKRHSDIDVQHKFLDVDIFFFQGRVLTKLHVPQPFFTCIVDIQGV